MKYTSAMALCASIVAAPVVGQAVTGQTPLVIEQKQETVQAVLPANTEVLLSMNSQLTTKGKTLSEGDTFYMTVVHNVMLGDYVVIPKGSRAAGEVTWLTSKGAFGKSGKMEIELRYVEIGGQRIELMGEFRQEGEGNTVATVGGVILAGVFAGFITGKSGRIPAGRELMARTKSDLPVAFAGPPPELKPVAIVATKKGTSPAPGNQPDEAVSVPVQDGRPVLLKTRPN